MYFWKSDTTIRKLQLLEHQLHQKSLTKSEHDIMCDGCLNFNTNHEMSEELNTHKKMYLPEPPFILVH